MIHDHDLWAADNNFSIVDATSWKAIKAQMLYTGTKTYL